MSCDPLSVRIAEADDAEAALARYLRPGFDAVKAAYLARMATLAADPLNDRATGSIKKLGLAIRIADEVRAQVEAVVADGKVARDQQQAVRRVEQMPESARRFF